MSISRSFNGVGPKTANCVLLFAFGKAVFPVDTHIHRIATRLGWIAPKSPPSGARVARADDRAARIGIRCTCC